MMSFCDMQPFKVWALMQKLGVITLVSDMYGYLSKRPQVSMV